MNIDRGWICVCGHAAVSARIGYFCLLDEQIRSSHFTFLRYNWYTTSWAIVINLLCQVAKAIHRKNSSKCVNNRTSRISASVWAYACVCLCIHSVFCCVVNVLLLLPGCNSQHHNQHNERGDRCANVRDTSGKSFHYEITYQNNGYFSNSTSKCIRIANTL